MKRALVLAVLVAVLSGCALTAPDPQRSCPVAGLSRMTMLQMYFGRGAVSDVAWNGFRDRVIAAQFPDGFTIYDAAGAWRPGPDRPTAHERAGVLEVAVPEGADIAAKVAAVSEAYKAEFHQQSVGVVTFRACGAF